MNYYPFHIGDYASSTRHLSWEEDLAYRRLLDVYYTIEKPLPKDIRAVNRLVLAQTELQREAVRVMLEEFFVETESGWSNKRADAEIASMRDKQEKQREKANKRWKKPAPEHGIASALPQHQSEHAAASICDADAMPPTPTPTPTPTPKKRDKKASPSAPNGHCVTFDAPSGDWSVPNPLREKWRAAYPAVSVDAELAKASAWLTANPKNRKSNYARFLNSWLSRAQDRAPVAPRSAMDAIFGSAH